MRDTSDWPHDHVTAAALLRGRAFDDAGAELMPIGEGDSCLAFRQRSNVVRVARHADAAAGLQREACVLATIATRLPFPVPRPTLLDLGAGRNASIHAEITGAPLTRSILEGLPSTARETTAFDVARFLGALHAQPPGIALACDVPVLDRAEYARQQRARCAPLYSRLASDTAGRLDTVLATWSAPFTDRPPPLSLLHGDLSPDHILVEPSTGRLTGVIDFGDLMLGDIARDFIFIHEDLGPAMLDAVLRHYRREEAATLLPRIRMWHLLEQVEWTLDCVEQRQLAEAALGLADITRELDTAVR